MTIMSAQPCILQLPPAKAPDTAATAVEKLLAKVAELESRLDETQAGNEAGHRGGGGGRQLCSDAAGSPFTRALVIAGLDVLLYFVAAANPIVALPAVMGTIAVVATIPGWSRYSSLKTAVKRGNAGGGEVGRFSFIVPRSHVVDVKGRSSFDLVPY